MAEVAQQYRGAMVGGQISGAPKPIGLMDRVAGLDSGLGQLSAMIESFASKTIGIGGTDANKETAAVGLPGSISSAEQNLRRCIDMMRQLHDTF